MPPAALSVAVLGPGGVGGLLAALLARAGAPVEVLASKSTAGTIAKRGLRIESKRFGDFHVPVRSATRLKSPVDVCLIAVKNTQLMEALDRVPPDALGQGLVVPFLNGIDHMKALRSIYPPSNVVAATIRVETTRVEPGLIRQLSPFASIQFAPSRDNQDRVEKLAAQLVAVGFDVLIRDDEASMLWDKLSFLGPFALLSTHERANAGAIRTRRRDDTIAVISEFAAVAAADGTAIDAQAVVRMMDSVPEAMESSMQRDQAAGLPLEIDAIGGVVVRRAAQAGVDVPVTARIVEELRTRRPGAE
jgi:2-dehydropantoate 2-reductase